MYKDDVRELCRALLTRGLQVDLTGTIIHHTHTKVDASVERPPMKLHLCTSASRPEGRMTDVDIQLMGNVCWGYAKRNKLTIPALASVPRVGDEIAKAVQQAAQKDGVIIPRLVFSKYEKDGIGYIGPLVDNGGYMPGQPVWLFDDLVHKGKSKMRAWDRVTEAHYTVTGMLVVMDYGQGAKELFKAKGIEFYAPLELRKVLTFGLRRKPKLISSAAYHAIDSYLKRSYGAAH